MRHMCFVIPNCCILRGLSPSQLHMRVLIYSVVLLKVRFLFVYNHRNIYSIKTSDCTFWVVDYKFQISSVLLLFYNCPVEKFVTFYLSTRVSWRGRLMNDVVIFIIYSFPPNCLDTAIHSFPRFTCRYVLDYHYHICHEHCYCSV